ncbi:MAG: 1-phosphofructokinase [Lachnospiraceae bacterium]|nr:1-phosphofructokinase [Lachnospiraceae bacterium]MDD3660341.1 1-phosphofructokinase [Lachnospiraceae bacterium]
MITTVSLNPAIDKTILLSSMDRGGVNRIAGAREDIGGKAINVAKILNRLGVETRICGFIGGENKQRVEELIAHEHLEYNFLEVEGLTRTNTKIVELDAGMTTDLNEQGFYIQDVQMVQLKDLMHNMAKDSQFTVFSGSIPKGLPDSIYKELIIEGAKDTKAVLDADGDLLVEGIKAGPYMIKPNIHELETAFQVTLSSTDEIVRFSRELIRTYQIRIVLVSMGAKGALLITDEECFHAGPVDVVVKSTVGAGDSMIAGMLYGIEQGLPLQEAFGYAAACGTLAVTKEGTQSFSLEEVKQMYEKVVVTKV